MGAVLGDPRVARGGRFARKDVIFICGYKADILRARYPEFARREHRLENNNIPASLMVLRNTSEPGSCPRTPVASTAAPVVEICRRPPGRCSRAIPTGAGGSAARESPSDAEELRWSTSRA
jgi:hypothetical protein